LVEAFRWQVRTHGQENKKLDKVFLDKRPLTVTLDTTRVEEERRR
jgi:hypothetical protein